MVPAHVRNTVLVVVGLVCGVGYGQDVAGLIARLEKLDGKNRIRGAVHIEDRISKTANKEAKPLEKADFIIRADANALTLIVAGEISNTRVFREFSLLRAAALTHYGPHLVRELDGLKLVEKRLGVHQGISCNRWRLESEKKEKRFGVSSTTRRDVELWIDANGYPVAASFKVQVKGRMLIFKFSSESGRQQRYERLGSRLILVFDKNEIDIKSRAGEEKRTVTTTVEVKKD